MNAPERALLLETSGRTGIVALAAGDRILGERLLPEARRHARDLAEKVRGLLSEQGWRARDVTAVVVGTGPGSYTGLRVGVTSAKALAFATGCAVFAVPTFEAVAADVAGGEILDVIGDAQQKNVYHQRFARGVNGDWEAAGPIDIRSLAEWAAEVPAGALVAGPAVSLYETRVPDRAACVAADRREPSARGLLRALLPGPERFRANAWQLEPIYLRGSSAEEKRKRVGTAGA